MPSSDLYRAQRQCQFTPHGCTARLIRYRHVQLKTGDLAVPWYQECNFGKEYSGFVQYARKNFSNAEQYIQFDLQCSDIFLDSSNIPASFAASASKTCKNGKVIEAWHLACNSKTGPYKQKSALNKLLVTQISEFETNTTQTFDRAMAATLFTDYLVDKNANFVTTIGKHLKKLWTDARTRCDGYWTQYQRELALARAAQDVSDRMQEIAKLESLIKAQAKALKGTLSNKGFSYYSKVLIPHPMPNSKPLFEKSDVLLLTGANFNDTCQSWCQGKAATGMIVEKGTSGVAKKTKYVKFKGIEKKEMFAGLKATGWNMSNLKKADDLEKVG